MKKGRGNKAGTDSRLQKVLRAYEKRLERGESLDKNG